jgi:hypothetical protein
LRSVVAAPPATAGPRPWPPPVDGPGADRKSCSADGSTVAGEEEFVDGTHDGPLVSIRCGRGGEIDHADDEAEDEGEDGDEVAEEKEKDGW